MMRILNIVFIFILLFSPLFFFKQNVYAGACLTGIYGQGDLDCQYNAALRKMVCNAGGICCAIQGNCPPEVNPGGDVLPSCPAGYVKDCFGPGSYACAKRGDPWKWFDDLVAAYLPADPAEHTSDPQLPAGPVFNTPDGLKEVVQSGGFADIQIVAETLETIYKDDEEWWATLWSHGGRADLEEIEKVHGADGLERFKKEVFKKIKAIKQAEGIHASFSVLFAMAHKPDA